MPIDDLPARVRRDLQVVVRGVLRSDRGVRAIILTGAFARGEGTMRGGRPLNDYDLVAVRDWRHRAPSYPALADALSRRLGLHVDLAAVPAWRLRLAAPTIFWYETALRGRVLWGEDLLAAVRVRDVKDLDPGEGLRLLANRAAGLLLSSRAGDDERRLQAAKALLASSDVHLLARGEFPPSQRERWARLRRLADVGGVPLPHHERVAWAQAYKRDPDAAPDVAAADAWRGAADAVLDAIPTALRLAGCSTLEEASRRGGLPERAVYLLRSRRLRGARRWSWYATGRIRVGTLRLLEDSRDGLVRADAARRAFAGVARVGPDPLATLAGLRSISLQ